MFKTKFNLLLGDNIILHMDSHKERGLGGKGNQDKLTNESMSSTPKDKASGSRSKDHDIKSILRSDENRSQVINIETKGANNTVQVTNSGDNINNINKQPYSNFLESDGDNVSISTDVEDVGENSKDNPLIHRS